MVFLFKINSSLHFFALCQKIIEMSAFPETPLPDAPPPPEEAGDETLWEKLSAFIMPAVTLTLLVSAAFPLFDGAEILSDGDTWEAIRWHAYAPSSLPARFSVTNVTIRVDRVATKLIGTDLALNFVLVQEWEDERLVVKRKGKPGLPSGEWNAFWGVKVQKIYYPRI